MTIIQSFEEKELKKRPLVIKIADKFTKFFGSIWFLVFNISLFVFWVFTNLGKIPIVGIFDPYPFFFLTTGVSLEAIILTIVVLISQQRQSHVSKIREELDMNINRISEKEITKALTILKKIAEKQGIKLDDDNELEEMIKGIEYSYIERKLEEKLSEKPKAAIGDVIKKVTSSLEPQSPKG